LNDRGVLRVLIEHFTAATAALVQPGDGRARLWQRSAELAIAIGGRSNAGVRTQTAGKPRRFRSFRAAREAFEPSRLRTGACGARQAFQL